MKDAPVSPPIRIGRSASLAAIAQLLRRRSWFNSLSSGFQRDLIERSAQRDVKRGTILWNPGEPADGIHCVLAGQFEIANPGAIGSRADRLLGRPGQWLGVLPAVGKLPRGRRAMATMDSKLLTLPQAELEAMLRTYPERYRDFIRLIAHYLAMTEAQVVSLKTQSGEQRLIGFLLRLSHNVEGIGEDAEDAPIAAMTQGGLADLAGLTRQRTNAVLKQLEKIGAISVGYRRIRVLDRETLARAMEQAVSTT